MEAKNTAQERLSPWWRRSVIVVLVMGFAVLIWMAVRAHRDAPPIPEKVVAPLGERIFTREDILEGQQVFLKYGLMENGTIWGHGAYLGPDFSAEYLHTLATDIGETLAKRNFSRSLKDLNSSERAAVNGEIQQVLKQNRYDPKTRTFTLTDAESLSFRNQIFKWTSYFSQPTVNRGLMVKMIHDPRELQQLTSFFAWTA